MCQLTTRNRPADYTGQSELEHQPHAGSHSGKATRKTVFNRGVLIVAFSLALCTFLARAAASDWPMLGYDASRRGASPAALDLPEDLHLQWVRELPPPRRAWPPQTDEGSKLEFDLSYSPIAMDGRVFVASMNTDCLTAYSLETGEELWRFYADGPARVAPAAWDGKVYFVSDDGRLYCLDAETGAKRWAFNAAPTDHRVLGNERVISMWPARGGPAIKDGTIYFAAGVWPFVGTFVYALDAETGDVRWANTGHSTEFQGQPHSGAFAFAGISPQGYLSVGEQHLVAAGGRAWPVVFDREDGSHRRSSGWGWLLPIDDDFYYAGRRKFCIRGERSGQNYVDIEHDAIQALNARVRDVQNRVEGRIFAQLVAGERLLVSTVEGRLYCFGAEEADPPAEHLYEPDRPEPEETAAGQKAAAILDETGVTAGYALVLGAADGELLEQIAARSELHMVVIEADTDRIDTVRRRLDRAGLYGERVAIIPGKLGDIHYPPYISSLIVATDPAAVKLPAQTEALELVYGLLRPHGGKAVLGFDPDQSATRAALAEFEPENGSVRIDRDAVILTREGALPGAGQWTHQYADSGQTVMSGDDRVRPPFGPIWYGGPCNKNILPRHAMGPRPQVAAGRFVILGHNTISARCAFSGRELWLRDLPEGLTDPFTNPEREITGSGGVPKQPGATYIGSPYVTLSDGVYFRYQNQVTRLDPDTGEKTAEWALPALPAEDNDEDSPDWGHISIYDDTIITTTNPHIWRDGRLGTRSPDRWDGTSSRRLVAMDRHSGEVLWTRDAEIGFRHNAIVSGNGRVFVNDMLSSEAVAMAERREMEIGDEPRIYALNVRTGEVLWSTAEKVFGTFLNYSSEQDLLIEGGSTDGRRHLRGEPMSRLTARRGKDGEMVWNRTGRRHRGPVIIHETTITSAAPGRVFCLLTGEDKSRRHPVTGGSYDARYWSHYGCGTSNAGKHLLLFRSGAAGFADVTHGSGTGTLGGFRAGCTANLVPAEGILVAPDYTRTCSCNYQVQTSLGLIHMPEMEVWMANRILPSFRGGIKRLGINLGAPGNRLAENGTFWVHVPRGAPSPQPDVLMSALDTSDTPVRIVYASSNDGDPAPTLDDDPDTSWRVRSDRVGGFGQWVQYDLCQPTELDRLDVAWSGPESTRLRIQVSPDGEEWTVAAEDTCTGPEEGEMRTYRFDPVEARHLRLKFEEHAARDREFAGIARVRIGGLQFPEAYTFFLPKDFWHKNALFVDGSNGPNWVAASGLRGIRELVFRDIQGEGNPYDIILHFAEPDRLQPGQRQFDIRIQGNKVAEAFDVVQAADGSNKAVAIRFERITIDNKLHLQLTPTDGSENPPVLSGVELIRRPEE